LAKIASMDVIVWIGFAQALFAGILTITKDKKSSADYLLSAWLFLLSIEFLTVGIELYVYTNFVFLSNTFLLFNPALFLYTRSLVKPSFRLKWPQLLHLLPYLIFKIFSWSLQEPLSFEGFFSPDNTLWYRISFGVFGLVSWIVYLGLTAVILSRHRKRLKNEFSTIDRIKKMGWIMFVVIFYGIYCLIVLLWGLFNIIVFTTESLTLFNYSVLLFFVYIFSFYGLKQRDIFPDKTKEEPVVPEKNSNSFLGTDQMEKISQKLLNYFQKEKPYLNPEFSMSLLSESLNIPRHHLTEVLNKHLGKNFFLFVNEYRVAAVKKQLDKPDNPYSIEAIGYECGFNSKSTFFSVFKTLTGQTPKNYQQEVLQKKN